MSISRALGIIDTLLQALDEADKRASCGKSTTCTATKEEKPAFTYIESLDGIEESQLVQITPDVDVLTTKWKEAGLGDNDELAAFCGQIGKVLEIETSDRTLQIQWENYDTCWVPALACGIPPKDAKATIPGTNNTWLNESKQVGDEYVEDGKEEHTQTAEEEEERYLASAEDPAAMIGNTVRVTKEIDILQEKWKIAELGPNNNLGDLLGEVGTIKEVNEDHDTFQLEWRDYKTTWVPIQACLVVGR